MFEIIRQTINSIGNVIENKHICFIDCEEDFLIKKVAPLLHTIAQCETNYHVIIKSDKQIAYKIKHVIAFDDVSYEEYFKNVLNKANEQLSRTINNHNMIIKHQNMCKGIRKNEGLIPEVKPYEYIGLFSNFDKEKDTKKLNDGLLIL